MTKINSFDVLKEVTKRNLSIKLFRADCIKTVDVGTKGWGWIKIAIDSVTAQEILRRMMADEPLMVNLLVTNPEDFKIVKHELEQAQSTVSIEEP